jgi:CheY-like chemotaxis protein
VELVVELDPAVPTVRADAGLLRQAVLNLVVNARDASRPGGRIVLASGSQDVGVGWAGPDGQLLVPGRYATLTVTDTGTGMDDETRRRIFEPFFTTKPPTEGTGLGLAVTLSSITQMSGQVVVASTLGDGTAVQLYLPAMPQAAPVAQPPGPTEPRGSAHVLLVEDTEAVRRLGRRILESAGYQVTEAPSGEAALSIMERAGDDIDLVVTDVMMPGMSGVELIHALHGSRPGLAALYLSGYPGDALARQGIAASGRDLLEKPFTRDALLAATRRALAAGEPEAG